MDYARIFAACDHIIAVCVLICGVYALIFAVYEGIFGNYDPSSYVYALIFGDSMGKIAGNNGISAVLKGEIGVLQS